MNNVEFHLQLNHNETWNMSRLHFHNYIELMLPLVSPGNIFVSDQIYPLNRATLYLIGENTLHRTITTGFHATMCCTSAERPWQSCPRPRPILPSCQKTPSSAPPWTTAR